LATSSDIRYWPDLADTGVAVMLETAKAGTLEEAGVDDGVLPPSPVADGDVVPDDDGVEAGVVGFVGVSVAGAGDAILTENVLMAVAELESATRTVKL